MKVGDTNVVQVDRLTVESEPDGTASWKIASSGRSGKSSSTKQAMADGVAEWKKSSGGTVSHSSSTGCKKSATAMVLLTCGMTIVSIVVKYLT